jgi:hypothetical protein
MSRWTESFEAHEFHKSFQDLQNELTKSKVTDEGLVTQVEELNRLGRVISFIEGVLDSVDPELVVANIWDEANTGLKNCLSQLEVFNSSNDVRYLVGANNVADKLLVLIRPYMIAGGKAGKALQIAVSLYAKKITEIASTIQAEIQSAASASNQNLNDTKKYAAEVRGIQTELQEYKEELFANTEVQDLRSDLVELKKELDAKKDEILVFHSELFEGDKHTTSLKNEFEEVFDEVKERNKTIGGMLVEIDPQVGELKDFYYKIFGDAEQNAISLKKEIEDRLRAITELEKSASKKTDELHTQIENLIPGATTAGLAFAFRQKKESFLVRIENSSILFYSMIALLVFSAAFFMLDFSKLNLISTQKMARLFLVMLFVSMAITMPTEMSQLFSKIKKLFGRKRVSSETNENGLSKASEIRNQVVVNNTLLSLTLALFISWFYLILKMGFAHYDSFSDVSRAFLLKAPVYGALIWLAFFATKRRSEYQRLEQEYAHKEALAISYDSYKQQIDALNKESVALQEKLLDKTIEAISFNAAQTLDKSHGDKMPAIELSDKILSR